MLSMAGRIVRCHTARRAAQPPQSQLLGEETLRWGCIKTPGGNRSHHGTIIRTRGCRHNPSIWGGLGRREPKPSRRQLERIVSDQLLLDLLLSCSGAGGPIGCTGSFSVCPCLGRLRRAMAALAARWSRLWAAAPRQLCHGTSPILQRQQS